MYRIAGCVLLLAGAIGSFGTAAAAAAAAAARGPLVPGVASVAVTDDAAALLTNPAALCRSVPAGGYFLWDHAENDSLRNGTGLFAARGFGFGYQVEQPQKKSRLNRLLLACGGAGRGPVSMGLRGSYEWQRIGWRDAAWRFDLGFLWRPSPFLSLGAVARDLNQASLHGTTYERGYSAGFGIRPLPGRATSRLTLYADVIGPENDSRSNEAFLHAGVWAEPVDGLSLGAAVDGPFDRFSDERNFSIGVRLDALHGSTLASVFFDRNDRRARTVEGFHMTAARQRTWQKEKVLTRTKIAGVLADEGQHALPLPFVGGQSFRSAQPVLHELANARKDPHVRGVLLDLEPVAAGALADEIRDEIVRVRAAGKPVVAFTKELTGRTALYIASACDRIVMDEMGSARELGIRRDILYYGETLDSAGIRFEKVARGKYKTAYEPFVLSRPSEGMLESLNSILDDVNDHQLALISGERKIARAELEVLVSGKWFSAQEALAAGMIDSVGDEKAARRILARLAGIKGAPEAVSVRGWTYPDYDWADRPKVAVVWLDGAIVDGRSARGLFSGNTIGSETVVAQLNALARRRDIKAVVLRIDSGGGSALASDEIWRAVDHLKRKGKKVVASMARVAGSGGYYIACNADRIVAEPTTITGSIGVLMVKPELTGLYDRMRIHVATFQRGDWMGLGSAAHPLTEEEREHIQHAIDVVYERFLGRAGAGRGLDHDAIDAVGQGRIWTGRQAKERRLVDELGGLEEAVSLARELAGLPQDAKVEDVRRPAGSWFERALLGAAARAGMPAGVPAASLEAAGAAPGPGLADSRDPLSRWILREGGRAASARTGEYLLRLENPLLEVLAEEP